MTSKEHLAKTNQETLLLMKTVEEKKKILAEAEADLNRLCSKVEKTNLELTGLKMERFKVEGLVQELNIRVKVYEMREKELKEQDESAKRSIKEAKNHLAREIEVRDSFNRRSSRKVIEMATKYCQFKNSCFKTNVVASIQDLKASHAAITGEIESKMQTLALGPENLELNELEDDVCTSLLKQVYQPTQNQEHDVLGVCELQKLVQAELDLVKAKNVLVASHVDRLLKRKSSLLKIMESLNKTWEK